MEERYFSGQPENLGLFQEGSASTNEEKNDGAEQLRKLWSNQSAVKKR
jgi:hypothetical protein